MLIHCTSLLKFGEGSLRGFHGGFPWSVVVPSGGCRVSLSVLSMNSEVFFIYGLVLAHCSVCKVSQLY